TFISYRNKSTGEVIEYDTSQPYPWDDDNFELVENSTRVVEVEPGIESQVQDFRFTDKDGYDPTQDLLAEPSPVLLIAMYDVLEADTDRMEQIRSLVDAASANGWYVYGLSASPFSTIEEVRHEYQLPFDFLQGDEKVIKTVIRANPGIVLMQEGTVKGKWSSAETPDFDQAKAKLQE